MSDVLQALASLVIVPSRQVPAQPAWLPAWPVGNPRADECDSSEDEATWPADEILPAKNALVHLPSLMEGDSPHHAAHSPVLQCLCAGI